jgi:hypothetical protein
MQAAEDRPPYVTFEQVAVEDRAASIEAGHYVAKNVDMAYITPMGSKDRIERVVSEWFENLEEQVKQQRFKTEWLSSYKAAYGAWKQGIELPPDGTPIKSWTMASPAQIKTLLAAHVRTVEDLAVANEETLGRLGMGGRALKAAAVAFLKQAEDVSKGAGRILALEQENASIKARNKELEDRFEKMEKQLERLAAKA